VPWEAVSKVFAAFAAFCAWTFRVNVRIVTYVKEAIAPRAAARGGIYMHAMFAMLNGWEVVALLAVVMIMFGAKRLPELAKGLGQGIREFKKGTQEDPRDPAKPA
jgi:sec-independent protein translocase protein TatA